jgi:tetratricopeptide (TPR) repeat protein
VGKSRLTYEFTHSPRSQGWLVLETASVSYGKATTYFPVIELLRSYCGIEPRDDERKIREKVTGKLLSLDRALEPTLPAFLSLLDVPVGNAEWTKLDPSQRRRQTLDALKRLLLRESQVQPLLLVVEDLHWIDSETQAWLDLLVESLPTARLLLLVNYRPEYGHGWGSKTYYQQVRLDALPIASAEELLKGLLGTGSGLAELPRLLIERTQGNPLFLEESVRALAETGALSGERGAYRLARPIQSLQLPATAQAILAARVDRLAPGDKRLLQAAAVIGKDVPFSLLEAIAEEPEERLHEGLARLQAAEFLYEARLFPELEYTFKHALTHEVAYAGLLQDRRRTLHARILEAMETLYTDRLDEHVERLAHHAVRGDVQAKAVLYLRQAGNKAGVRSALRDARARYEQALGVLQALPVNQSTLEQGFEIRLELRTVLTQLAELRAALERLREAETLSERLNDDDRRARVCSVLMTLHTLLGELDEAVAIGTRALEMAGRLGDLRLRILTTSYLEQAQYYRGEYQRVVELATDALAVLPADWIYEHFGMVAPASVYARSWLVISLAELGTFGEAAEHAAEAISLAEPTHHAYTIGLAHRAAGTLHLLEGDWATARSLLEHGVAVLRAGNVSLSLPHTLVGVAWALAQLGATSEALNRLRDGEQALAAHARAGMRRAWDDYVVGRTWLLLDRPDEARAVGQRAVELLPSQPAGAAHALHLLGDIEAHSDPPDAERAETYYRKALALAEPRGMRPLVAHCHLGLGKLARRAGKHQQASQHLTTATTMYREMGMRFWLEQAEMATAEPA